MAAQQSTCDTHPEQCICDENPCIICHPKYPEMFIPFMYENISKEKIKLHIEDQFGLNVTRIGFSKKRQNKKGDYGSSVYITVKWTDDKDIISDELNDIRNNICMDKQYEIEDVPGGRWLIMKNSNCKPPRKRNTVLKLVQ
jgi:hypothetical protein